MTLPLLLSVPHAGLWVPPEVQDQCQLSPDEVAADGDVGAAEIYALNEHAAQFVTTDVARAIVDLNRADDDFRADGIIKTHTCWNVPVYRSFPTPDLIEHLLSQYYRPYHETLRRPVSEVRLCVDCHTMAAEGPPIGPDTGVARPAVCLGDVNGSTLPAGWMKDLAACFEQAFGEAIAVNEPFSGGYITRCHGEERPWVQLELSRAPFLANEEKRSRVLLALTEFCRSHF